MEDYTNFYNEEDIVWQFNRVMVDKRSKNLKDFLTTDLKNNSEYYGLFSDFLDKTRAIDRGYDIQKVIKENEDLIIEESKKAKETIFVSYLKHHEKKDKIHGLSPFISFTFITTWTELFTVWILFCPILKPSVSQSL
ncbi:MAG: hypothetical protein ACP5HC_09630 [Caldisericum sp.]